MATPRSKNSFTSHSTPFPNRPDLLINDVSPINLNRLGRKSKQENDNETVLKENKQPPSNNHVIDLKDSLSSKTQPVINFDIESSDDEGNLLSRLQKTKSHSGKGSNNSKQKVEKGKIPKGSEGNSDVEEEVLTSRLRKKKPNTSKRPTNSKQKAEKRKGSKSKSSTTDNSQINCLDGDIEEISPEVDKTKQHIQDGLKIAGDDKKTNVIKRNILTRNKLPVNKIDVKNVTVANSVQNNDAVSKSDGSSFKTKNTEDLAKHALIETGKRVKKSEPIKEGNQESDFNDELPLALVLEKNTTAIKTNQVDNSSKQPCTTNLKVHVPPDIIPVLCKNIISTTTTVSRESSPEKNNIISSIKSESKNLRTETKKISENTETADFAVPSAITRQTRPNRNVKRKLENNSQFPNDLKKFKETDNSQIKSDIETNKLIVEKISEINEVNNFTKSTSEQNSNFKHNSVNKQINNVKFIESTEEKNKLQIPTHEGRVSIEKLSAPSSSRSGTVTYGSKISTQKQIVGRPVESSSNASTEEFFGSFNNAANIAKKYNGKGVELKKTLRYQKSHVAGYLIVHSNSSTSGKATNNTIYFVVEGEVKVKIGRADYRNVKLDDCFMVIQDIEYEIHNVREEIARMSFVKTART